MQSFLQKHATLKTINTVNNKEVKEETQLRHLDTIFFSL